MHTFKPFDFNFLAQTDPECFALHTAEATRQQEGLELIASENYASLSVRLALASVFTNKYSEGYPGRRYYAGNEIVDHMEQLAIDRARILFGAEHINVQPLSGAPANIAVFTALLKPGDTVLGMALDQGGHLTHGHPLNFSGKTYTIISYGVRKDTEVIDMEEVKTLAHKHRPKLIIVGFSAYSRTIDWHGFRDIADELGAVLMADIAHIAGLIAGKVIENPVALCDVVTTTTHKTLRGPRGAVIFCKNQFAEAIDKAVFPGIQGGPHENVIFAKAVAFGEALQPAFTDYAAQVVANAQTLAQTLIEQGMRVVSGGTDNHLLLLDVFGSLEMSGKLAEVRLEQAGIYTNKNMIPFDTRKPLDPSGIRLGSAALTTRGARESDMQEIAELIVRILKQNLEPEAAREHVRTIARKLPIPGNSH